VVVANLANNKVKMAIDLVRCLFIIESYTKNPACNIWLKIN